MVGWVGAPALPRGGGGEVRRGQVFARLKAGPGFFSAFLADFGWMVFKKKFLCFLHPPSKSFDCSEYICTRISFFLGQTFLKFFWRSGFLWPEKYLFMYYLFLDIA